MRKIAICLFVCIFVHGYSNEWADHLILSSQAYDEKNYDLAIFHINSAIAKSTKSEGIDLKIQKAKYLIENRQDNDAIECINDLENEISGELTIKQQVDCAEVKLIAFAKLQNAEKAQECFAILKRIDSRLPKFTHTKDQLIISNCHRIPNYEKFIKCTMIHTQIAENSNSIKFYDNGICVVKKISECPCLKLNEEQEPFICDCCGKTMVRIEPKNSDYKWNCSGARTKLEGAGLVFCGARFAGSNPCLLACCTAVYAITDACKYCCQEGGVYQNCIKPYEDILKRCPPECEPI